MADWFDRLPKAELHLHLEGAIPLEAMATLIRKYGGDETRLAERFRFRDFPHFIETWRWKSGFLREVEDFRFIAEAVARDLARQQVRYAEVFFAPGEFAPRGLRTQPLAEAVRAGLSQVPGVEIALVGDLIRNLGPERGARTLAELAELKGLGVIGIGLGGSEERFPPAPYAPVYAEARRLGLRTTVHAGEASGAGSVREALDALKPDRIGHGTRAIEDGSLMDRLVREKIPVEMCPLSNVKTRVVGELKTHPVRAFADRGIPVSINTDDPLMFGNSLAAEYRGLVAELGFDRAGIRRLVLNAVETSWLPPDRKLRMAADFAADPVWKEDA